MSDQTKPATGEWTDESLARFFHDTYEMLAPSFGYETRPDTREFNPESKNGRLMVTVCGAVLLRFNAALAAERDKRQAAEQRAAAYHRQIGDENKMTEQLLADEREKRMTPRALELSREIQQLRSQLAEVEEHNIRGAIHPDVLARHIAEAQKPLVDAWQTSKAFMDYFRANVGVTDEWPVEIKVAEDSIEPINTLLNNFERAVYNPALAKVKEGKRV